MATGRVPTTANSPLTAKGDLFGYSTAPARLAVGNDGEQIVADSSTSTGLRYIPAPVMANPVVNGGADIWQRGTSFTITSTNVYTADRWTAGRGGGAAGQTISRQTVSDTTNLPNILYAIRSQRTAGNTSTAGLNLVYSMESDNSKPFAGRTVTISFFARRGADFSGTSNQFTFYFNSGTGTDQSVWAGFTGATSVVQSPATLTTSWQRFTFTGTVPSNSNQLGFYMEQVPTAGTAGTNDWFEVTGFQIDVGSVALPFRRAGGTIQGELSACQRYYFRETGSSIYLASGGIAGSTTAAYVIMRHPVTMRVAPTSVDYSSLRLQIISNTFNLTNCTISDASPHGTVINATVASGLTATTQSYMLMTQASATAHLGLSAEL
jgi:hypothetical protein